MKIHFILIISLIFQLIACSHSSNKKELLQIIKEQDLLLSRTVFISMQNDVKEIYEKKGQSLIHMNDMVELTIQIPLDTLNEKNIEIKDKEISLSLPPAQIKKNEFLLNKKVQEILFANKNHIEQLKTEIQEFATKKLGEILKSKEFRVIKIRFTSI